MVEFVRIKDRLVPCIMDPKLQGPTAAITISIHDWPWKDDLSQQTGLYGDSLSKIDSIIMFVPREAIEAHPNPLEFPPAAMQGLGPEPGNGS